MPEPVPVDSEEPSCHHWRGVRCPWVWLVLDSFHRQFVPLEFQHPVESTVEVFLDELVAEGAVVDGIDYWAHNHLECQAAVEVAYTELDRLVTYVFVLVEPVHQRL